MKDSRWMQCTSQVAVSFLSHQSVIKCSNQSLFKNVAVPNISDSACQSRGSYPKPIHVLPFFVPSYSLSFPPSSRKKPSSLWQTDTAKSSQKVNQEGNYLQVERGSSLNGYIMELPLCLTGSTDYNSYERLWTYN